MKAFLLLALILAENLFAEDKINIKLVTLGDSAVGKSSLTDRYMLGHFKGYSMATLALDYRTKIERYNGKKYKLSIWDTAGQERFRSHTSAYIRSANVILLVYDTCNSKSYTELENYWISKILKENLDNLAKNFTVIIVGNKVDLTEDKVVSPNKAKSLAKRNKWSFFETSAKTGKNVEELFKHVIEEFDKKNKRDTNREEEPRESISLNDESNTCTACSC